VRRHGCDDVFLKDTTTRRSVSADATSALLTVRSSSEHRPNAGKVDGPNAGKVDGPDAGKVDGPDAGGVDAPDAGLGAVPGFDDATVVV